LSSFEFHCYSLSLWLIDSAKRCCWTPLYLYVRATLCPIHSNKRSHHLCNDILKFLNGTNERTSLLWERKLQWRSWTLQVATFGDGLSDSGMAKNVWLNTNYGAIDEIESLCFDPHLSIISYCTLYRCPAINYAHYYLPVMDDNPWLFLSTWRCKFSDSHELLDTLYHPDDDF
jgi:hypothetical protein